MIVNEPVFLKKICLWCLIVTFSIIAVCLVFISVVSVWTGFANMHQSAFWVPVLGGAFLLISILFLFFRTTKFILGHMKEEDVLNP